VEAYPALRNRQDRFLSLDALLLPGPWPRLFLDSDILVCGDLSGMMIHSVQIVACPDATMLRGRERHDATFAEIEPNEDDPPKPSFNAGVILIQGDVADSTVASELLELLSPQRWQAVASDHTDQAVWNQLFRDHVGLIEPAYNFMVGHAGLYREAQLQDIRLLHFNGGAKPWLPDRFGAAIAQGGLVAEAFEMWRLACKAMLQGAP
jgi:lipopolysaccharide biosynthesis glycosyltransferase